MTERFFGLRPQNDSAGKHGLRPPCPDMSDRSNLEFYKSCLTPFPQETQQPSDSRSALASCKFLVSNPSVNQL